MGLFGKIFDKKTCDICGGEIGLLGNRKLDDGNLCKNCASKLSPFFSDRRSSTVAQIKEQLDYREENKKAVADFHTTRTLGNNTKVLLDEDNRKFMVTSARNLQDANPDVMDFSQVTGCKLDIDEDRNEIMRENSKGEQVSYHPPRYEYNYDFYIVINVNHPYFDTIRFRINSSSIEVTPPVNRPGTSAVTNIAGFARTNSLEFREAEKIGKDIVEALTGARQQTRDEAAAANAPKIAVTCPFCGASTIPDAMGRCEYCGGSVNG